LNDFFYFLVVAPFEYVLETAGDSDAVVPPQAIMSYVLALNAKNNKQQQSRRQGSAKKQKDTVDAYYFSPFLFKKISDAAQKDIYTDVKR
jgi:hypothetical protein